MLYTGTVPDADQLTIGQAPDPATGGEYPGTDVDLTTITLTADWVTTVGTFSSYTGGAVTEATQVFDGQWDALEAGSYTSLDGSWTVNRIPCPDVAVSSNGLSNCSPIGQKIDFDNETDLFIRDVTRIVTGSLLSNMVTIRNNLRLLGWRDEYTDYGTIQLIQVCYQEK